MAPRAPAVFVYFVGDSFTIHINLHTRLSMLITNTMSGSLRDDRQDVESLTSQLKAMAIPLAERSRSHGIIQDILSFG